MAETIKIQRPRIDTELAAESANSAERTVEMQFYSGAAVRRYSFMRGGEYMLSFSMDPASVRLGNLNSGRAPVLESHSDWSTKDVLGVIEKGWIEDGKGKAMARFAKGDEAADSVWNKVQQKILRNVSMGVAIHKLKETSKEGDPVRSFQAVDWEPLEISIVPIGADPDAQMLASEQVPEIEVEVTRASSPIKESLMQENTTTDPKGEVAQKAEATKTEVPKAPIALADEQLNNAHKIGATAEQGRITGIIRVAKVCGLDLSFAETHIAQNTTLENFRALAIDKQALAASRQEVRTIHADILHDEADTRRRSMSGALLERFKPNQWSWNEGSGDYRFHPEGGQRPFEGSRNYAACTLLDIAKECLGIQGIRWQNKSRNEIAQLAFQGTSDFPNILAAVTGKSLRAGYEMVPAQWRLIAARRNAPDFKSVKELVLDSSSRLEKVVESGEFRRGKLVEGQESWQLSTYGKIIAITRQAIINDDLGAFTRTPLLLGQEVAMLEADTVFGIITTNGAMADAVALFHATHGNLVSSGAAVDASSINAGRLLMMKQTSKGGKPLNVTPRYIVVPVSAAMLAEQYTSTGYVAATPANINPFAGRLTPIVDSHLDAAASGDDWYLFADPNSPNGEVLIYAYLDGQEGPYTETENGFDVDGVQVKIRHDFAAAAIDYRGAVKNPGAS